MLNVRIDDCVMMLMLVAASYIDIKRKALNYKELLVVMMAAVLCVALKGTINPYSIIPVLIIGIMLFLVSLVTRQGFGMADACVVTAIALSKDFVWAVSTLMCALVIVCIISVIQMLRKKMTKKSSIPFIPFITAGYIMSFVFGKGGLV